MLPAVLLICAASCAASAFFGMCLGRQKGAALDGFMLGLCFGPFGVIAAGLADNRPNCARCGGRRNLKPNGQRYQVCEHCGCESLSPQLRPQRPILTAANVPPDICTIPVENDPDWESSLTEAKRQLEQAGLIDRK